MSSNELPIQTHRLDLQSTYWNLPIVDDVAIIFTDNTAVLRYLRSFRRIHNLLIVPNSSNSDPIVDQPRPYYRLFLEYTLSGNYIRHTITTLIRSISIRSIRHRRSVIRISPTALPNPSSSSS